jgi:hypothetical protein
MLLRSLAQHLRDQYWTLTDTGAAPAIQRTGGKAGREGIIG